ncbi:MAG: hypothetical protein UT94_C0024G0018 [Candidatus Uhrbacteria bacterium GW2011_GWF2_40_263]|nr:MAG: hypothetical protein UT94_C0024G0018 [Candidatus Uhrbacteria bacterium GW2011_GWF2_40_263]
MGMIAPHIARQIGGKYTYNITLEHISSTYISLDNYLTKLYTIYSKIVKGSRINGTFLGITPYPILPQYVLKFLYL